MEVAIEIIKQFSVYAEFVGSATENSRKKQGFLYPTYWYKL